MAVEKEIIVAVEFGSSKIRGVAGCKNIDGSVQVLDIEQVDARHCETHCGQDGECTGYACA